MPRKTAAKFREEYFIACRYKWEFLRRNAKYQKVWAQCLGLNPDALGEKKGRAPYPFYAAAPSKFTDGTPDPGAFGIHYFYDPAKSERFLVMAGHRFSRVLMERDDMVYVNPFHDPLAAPKVFQPMGVVHKDGYADFFEAFVFDMRVSTGRLLAEFEVVFKECLRRRRKAGLLVPKAQRMRNPPFMVPVDEWDYAGEQEDREYFFATSIQIYDTSSVEGIMDQVQDALSGELGKRRCVGAPLACNITSVTLG